MFFLFSSYYRFMTERQADGGFGTFIETIRDLETRIPEPTEHAKLTQAVEVLPEDEVRRRLVALLEAVNPQIDCICSDLSQVNEVDARICGYHTSRAGWIVHQARQFTPRTPE